jgi:hypothetical protein
MANRPRLEYSCSPACAGPLPGLRLTPPIRPHAECYADSACSKWPPRPPPDIRLQLLTISGCWRAVDRLSRFKKSGKPRVRYPGKRTLSTTAKVEVRICLRVCAESVCRPLPSKFDVRSEFDVARTVTVKGLPKAGRLEVVAATRPGEHWMVKGVEKLRLQHEADTLRE